MRTITSVNHLPRLTDGLAVSLCLLAITMVGPWYLERPLSAAETIAHRPNFLVIVTDDQSAWDLRVYNPQSELDTPQLDQLAARGMVVDGAYHMGSFVGAVCSPSRHMIMSGRTVWHLPHSPEAARTCPPNLEQQTLAAVFNRAGYATMRTCKLGNSYEAANRQFAVRLDATKRGDTPETGSAWHADQVIEFLHSRQAAADHRPFLIYLGFSHPHDPRDAPPDLLAKYGASNHTDPASPPPANTRQPRLPLNYLPAHPFDTTHSDVRDEIDVSGVWRRRDEASIRNEIGRQLACCDSIDQQIGRVLELLEKQGLLENTYVIFTSDHGMAIGRHGLMGKQNLYQHTWRVPLVVAGPGIAAGSRAPGNVYLLDLLATLCDLADIQPPDSNEGLSFRPVLEKRQAAVRTVMYGVYSGGAKPGIRCLQQDRWKLIEYEAAERGVRQTQLFDLHDNPLELMAEHDEPTVRRLTGNRPAARQRNLADQVEYAERLAAMRGLLLDQMRRLDDPYRFSDQPQEDPRATVP